MKKLFLSILLIATILVTGCEEIELPKNNEENISLQGISNAVDEVTESATDKISEVSEKEDVNNIVESIKDKSVKIKEKVEKAVEENGSKKATHTSGTTDKIPVVLVRVVDGDTIRVIYDGQEHSVRYLLIDTPETKHPKLGEQPFGKEASKRNKELINSGQLYLEFDVGERFDRYDRLLAYVYVDDINIQEVLLEEGLARVAYVYPPNTRHLDLYEKAENKAKEKGVGIWSVEGYVTPSGFDAN